jgi:hypothetical protein
MTIKSKLTGPYLNVEASDVLSEDDLPALFDAFEKAHKLGPFVVLTDTTNLKSSPRGVISAFAQGIKSVAPGSKNWLGDAVVVKSAAVRFVLSTLIVVAPLPTEVKAFDDPKEAKRWCAWLLRREGLSIPAELLKSA